MYVFVILTGNSCCVIIDRHGCVEDDVTHPRVPGRAPYSRDRKRHHVQHRLIRPRRRRSVRARITARPTRGQRRLPLSLGLPPLRMCFFRCRILCENFADGLGRINLHWNSCRAECARSFANEATKTCFSFRYCFYAAKMILFDHCHLISFLSMFKKLLCSQYMAVITHLISMIE